MNEFGTVISASTPDHPVVVELDGTAAKRVVLYWSDFDRVGLKPTVGQRVAVRSADTDPFLCGPAEEGEVYGSGI